jgi:hypothetical protein
MGDLTATEYGFLYHSSGGKNQLLAGPIASVPVAGGKPEITVPEISGANVAAHTHDWTRPGSPSAALTWSDDDTRFNSRLSEGASSYMFTLDGILRTRGVKQGETPETDCLVGVWPTLVAAE